MASESEVFVNGSYAGRHHGSFTSFKLDLIGAEGFLGAAIWMIVPFLILAFLLWLISLFSKVRFAMGKAITLSFLSGGNFILFIPIGMIFFRLFQYRALTGYLILLIVAINLWFIFT